jgi:cyanate permease
MVVKPVKYRFVIAGLSLLMSLSTGLVFLNVSPITPLIMDEYGVNRSTASLLVAGILFANAAMAIPCVLLVGRVRIVTLISLFGLLAAIPIFSFGADNFFVLLLLRMTFGVCAAGIIPLLFTVLMQWFPPKELPLVNGLNLAMMSGGIAISLYTGEWVAEWIGWKNGLALYSVPSLIGAVFWLLFARSNPALETVTTPLTIKSIKKIFLSKLTVLLALADAGPLSQYVALSTWLPTFYYEVHGMSLADSGGMTAILPLAGMVTVFVAGILALKVPKRKPFMMVSGAILGVTGIASSIFAASDYLYFILIVYGASSWLYTPFHMTIPMEVEGATEQQTAALLACIFTIGGFISFCAPVLVGIFTDVFGSYMYGFWILALISWSLVVATFMLPETGVSRDRKARAV